VDNFVYNSMDILVDNARDNLGKL